MRHPVSEEVAALYHLGVGLLTLVGVWFHLEAARRHWGARGR
jgi:hypothetical protein